MGNEILIVDDVETNRFILRDIILEMELRPILTENGVQALRMIEKRPPKLIILDIAMPEMDGYELCKIIKENPNTREIPIIFISAFDEPEDIVKGFGLGGGDYITKPFIPEVVKARVGLHLKLSQTRKDMQELNRKLQVSVSEQLRQVEESKKNVLYALNRVVQDNPIYQETQMERLSYNAKVLAEAMQLSVQFGDQISDQYIEAIEVATPLSILGQAVLEDIMATDNSNTFLEMAVDILHYHDKNWQDEELPLCAQIVAVAVGYCKLSEEQQDTLEELKQSAGTKYNPDIVTILCKIKRQLH